MVVGWWLRCWSVVGWCVVTCASSTTLKPPLLSLGILRMPSELVSLEGSVKGRGEKGEEGERRGGGGE